MIHLPYNLVAKVIGYLTFRVSHWIQNKEV